MHQEALEGMLVWSPQLQEVFATIRRVTATAASVVSSGESGTGKGLVTWAIPEDLLESEL